MLYFPLCSVSTSINTRSDDLHRLGTIAQQQRGHVSPDGVPWFQRDRVLVKGVLNRPPLAQVPVGDRRPEISWSSTENQKNDHRSLVKMLQQVWQADRQADR